MKKNVCILSFLIVINLLGFIIGYYNYLYPTLGNFSIEEIVETTDSLVLNVSKSVNAISYDVKIYKDDELYYETASDSNSISLNDFKGEYNDEYLVTVTSINKNNLTKECSNTYNYIYSYTTFDTSESHLVSGYRDLTINLLGYSSSDTYTILLYYGNSKIYEGEVTKETVVIPYEYVDGYYGRITAYLIKDDSLITSTFNFYLNTPVVGKISINEENISTRWDDVTITFTGGVNANHFWVKLINEDTLENRIELDNIDNTITIPAEFFKENSTYTVVLEAVYEDYIEIEEKDSLTVVVGGKETTSSPYVSHNPSSIKSGTKVTLQTISDETTIYYTTDGSDPNENSNVYQYAFTITEDVTIKAIAISNNRYNSEIQTFNFHVEDKTPVIFISPSNQGYNYGVAGYTNEKEVMNKLADVVVASLKEAGFIVYRNNPNTDIDSWISTSNYIKADFHLAIHSNASSAHNVRGIEIFVDKATSLSYSIASNIYESLWKIYDGNDDYTRHRGVKYANGSLGEANDNYLPCGALIEVAFHDEESDASWIINNLETIGKNIANSIISYYN